MEEPGPDNTEGRAHARHREPEIQLLTIMGLITKIPGCPITHSQYLTIIHHVHPSYIIFHKHTNRWTSFCFDGSHCFVSIGSNRGFCQAGIPTRHPGQLLRLRTLAAMAWGRGEAT